MEGLCATIADGQYINNGSQRACGDLGRINEWRLFLYYILSGSFFLALLRGVGC